MAGVGCYQLFPLSGVIVVDVLLLLNLAHGVGRSTQTHTLSTTRLQRHAVLGLARIRTCFDIVSFSAATAASCAREYHHTCKTNYHASNFADTDRRSNPAYKRRALESSCPYLILERVAHRCVALQLL